jgi:hypothetical protein
MKYLQRPADLYSKELSEFLGFWHHMEKKNDQNDPRDGRADRGNRIRNPGHCGSQ